MIGLLIAIHAIVCILLIGIILIQSGRGGGLVSGFSGMESMFGTKTNSFLTRTTTILAAAFFVTCLSLAFLSASQSRSLMKDATTPKEAQQQNAPAATAEKTEQPAQKAQP